MATKNDSGWLTVKAYEALGDARLVKISVCRSGSTPPTVNYCDSGEVPDGVTEAVAAANDIIAVKQLNGGIGTYRVTTNGAIAGNTDVYPSDDGKVQSAASGGARIGTIIEASSADGGIVEMVR